MSMRKILAVCVLAWACDDTTEPAPYDRDASPVEMADAALPDAQVPDAQVPDAQVPDAAADDAGIGMDASTELDANLPDPPDASTGCPPLAERTVVEVPFGPLPDALTHWTCDKLYVLTGIVFVHGDAASPQVLTIDPGTVVHGQVASDARGFLVVTRQGRIEAQGTADAPIVFTSQNPVGQRARDDWGGLTLLGRATPGGTRRVEGFPLSVGGETIDPLLAYGPLPEAVADESHDCGTLHYVRIEFASFNAGGGQGNESNALQLYACGSGTSIDHVQTHLSGDDGIELFGGSVDVRHLVLTGASDDSLDWDDGWHGRAQFVVGQQHPDQADLGFEAGGGSDTPLAAPDPRLFNVTLVGTNGADVGKLGGRLRGASRGTLANVLLLGFSAGSLDIGGTAAAQNFRSGALSFTHSVFFRAGASTTFPTGADDTPDDVNPDPAITDNVDEAVELMESARANRELDPALAAPFDLTMPSFVPMAGSALTAGVAPSERATETAQPFFDVTADYVGAFEPDGDDWTAGWTAFPAD